MLGFGALSEAALSELAGSAPTTANADGAITVDITVAGDAAHGVAGDGAITVGVTVAGDATFTTNVNVFDGAVTVDFAVAGDAAHGVAGEGAVTVGIIPTGDAAHGVAGTGAVSVGITAAGDAAHGVAADGAVTVSLSVAGDFLHPRYEVRGQVQQGGVLINRRVRVYRRDTGELAGEGDTALGSFKITTGFAAREHYIIPINLADDATDWVSPVANRVVSVLAQD